MSESKLVASKKTPHQRIDLEVLDDGSLALYLDRCIQFVSGQDDVAYHGTLADLPVAKLAKIGKRPSKALVLGGGDGLAARNLLRHPGVQKVTLVEIDPGMVDFCSSHPRMRMLNEDAFEDPRLETVIADAREFVAAAPRDRYDLALVDFPDPEDRIQDLFGAGFYRQVIRHLTPGAIIAVQASAAGCPVERVVGQNLAKALMAPVRCARFRGRRMEDGAIILGRVTEAAIRLAMEEAAAAARWPRPVPPLNIASMSE